MKRIFELLFGLFAATISIVGITTADILYGKILFLLPFIFVAIPLWTIYIVTNFGKRTFAVIIKRQVGEFRRSVDYPKFYPLPENITDLNHKYAAIQLTYILKKTNGKSKTKKMLISKNIKDNYNKPAVVLRKIGFIYCLDTKDTLTYKFTEEDLLNIKELEKEIQQ